MRASRTPLERAAQPRRADAAIEAVLAARDVAHWVERLNAAGVPGGPVLDLAQVFADPQVLAREMLVELPHPGARHLPDDRLAGEAVAHAGRDRAPAAAARRAHRRGAARVRLDATPRSPAARRRRARRRGEHLVERKSESGVQSPRRDRLAARPGDGRDGGRPCVGRRSTPAAPRWTRCTRWTRSSCRPGSRERRSTPRSSSRAGSRTCARRPSCSCRGRRSRSRPRAASRADAPAGAIDRHLVVRGLLLVAFDALWLSLLPFGRLRATTCSCCRCCTRSGLSLVAMAAPA